MHHVVTKMANLRFSIQYSVFSKKREVREEKKEITVYI